jgi:SP family arabinose:H+ symporter-like MFS transporter
MKLNWVLLSSTAAASLGGFLFGFDTAVIAGATHALTALYHLTPASLGVTVASALWGTVAGASAGGVIADRLGRRDGLRLIALLYVLSALGCAFAWSWLSLIAFRVIGGIAIGASSVVGPMYIAEIAPARYRGRLVGLFQFNVVLGILIAYVSNYLISSIFGDGQWRVKLGIAALPALLFFISLVRIPRSPRWLVKKGHLEEARQTLLMIGEENVEQELQEISESVDRKVGGQRLFTWRYRVPILLAVSIGMFNQLSGINAILYYLNDIFARAGFSALSSDIQAVVIGLMNLLAVTVAMSVIDRIGRRKLLLIGSVACAASLAGVAWVFFSGGHGAYLLWFLSSFICFFSFSQGAVIWVYISEIFPNNVRAAGQSLGSFSHWFMNAVVSGIFPLMAARSGGYPFVFFAAMMVVQFFTVFFFYPETQQISLESLEHRLGFGRQAPSTTERLH